MIYADTSINATTVLIVLGIIAVILVIIYLIKRV